MFGDVNVTFPVVTNSTKLDPIIFGYGSVLSGTLVSEVPPLLVQDSSCKFEVEKNDAKEHSSSNAHNAIGCSA